MEASGTQVHLSYQIKVFIYFFLSFRARYLEGCGIRVEIKVFLRDGPNIAGRDLTSALSQNFDIKYLNISNKEKIKLKIL